MMKKAMMICVLTLMAVGAFSQERQKGHWTITPRVGITMPFYHGGYIGFEENIYGLSSVIYDKHMKTEGIIKRVTGIEAEYQFNPSFGLSAGTFYSEHDVEMPDQTNKFVISPEGNGYQEESYQFSNYRLNVAYLDIPVMANFHVYKGLSLKAGLQLGLLLRAEAKENIHEKRYVGYTSISGTVGGPIEHIEGDYQYKDETYDDSFSMLSSYKRLKFSVPVGASYVFRNIELDARYVIGINNILKDKGHGKSVKESYLMLTVGYRFEL